MRTGYVIGGQIKHGRSEEAIAQAQEAAKLFERLGADEIGYRFGGGGTANGSTTWTPLVPSPSGWSSSVLSSSSTIRTMKRATGGGV